MTEMRPSSWRLAAAAAAAVAALAVAGAAQSAPLSLIVTFSATGAITVTLPNGTPVGTTSGAPTVIPAGYYVIQMYGPGGCAVLPHWNLRGPGEAISDNMTEGEVNTATYNAYFQPNATYTWVSDAAPSVVHTFVTTADVQGTPPATAGPGGLAASNHGTISSSDLVGSTVLLPRGTLTATVSASGKLSLRYRGRPVTALKQGRYVVVVTDESRSSGFIVRRGKYPPTVVTTRPFTGTRRYVLELRAGTWLFMPRPGQAALSVRLST